MSWLGEVKGFLGDVGPKKKVQVSIYLFFYLKMSCANLIIEVMAECLNHKCGLMHHS